MANLRMPRARLSRLDARDVSEWGTLNTPPNKVSEFRPLLQAKVRIVWHIPSVMKPRTAIAALTAVGALSLTLASASGQVTIIEPSSGNLFTDVTCLSADGRSISGDSSGFAGIVPFIWKADTGRVDLTSEPRWARQNFSPQALSGDGSVMVGAAVLQNERVHAFRWNGVGTLQDLGTVGDYRYSWASAVSRGGRYIAGELSWDRYRDTNTFIWSAETGMQALGDVPWGGSTGTVAVSQDGNTVVGESSTGIGTSWLWTRSSGYSVLPQLNRPGAIGTRATAANADCSIIVGAVSSFTAAIMWTESGVEELGQMIPSGVDDLGTVVIGADSLQNQALIWTRATGVIPFTAYLSSMNITTPEWFDPYRLTGISADGMTICGNTRSQSGSRGFVVHVPTSSSITGIAMISLATRRRRPVA